MTTDITFRFDDPHEADRLLHHFEHGDYNGRVVSETGDYIKPKEYNLVLDEEVIRHGMASAKEVTDWLKKD